MKTNSNTPPPSAYGGGMSAKDMSDTELKLTIALLLGWTWEQPFNRRKQSNRLIAPNKKAAVTVWKTGPMGGADNMPDWPNDLNACHEMEMVLMEMDKQPNVQMSSRPQDRAMVRYTAHLGKIVGAKLKEITVWTGRNLPCGKPELLATSVDASPFESQKLIHATARQRCLAFIQTLRPTSPAPGVSEGR